MGITATMFIATALSFLPLIVATISNSSDGRSSCKSGWLDASLVNLGCLLFDMSAAKSWEKASDLCQSQENARLVEVETQEQFDFLMMELEVIDNQDTKHDWWTAGTDIGREGDWYWTGSLSSVNDFAWYGSEPNSGSGYNCLLLFASYSYAAVDYPCSNSKYPICQELM